MPSGNRDRMVDCREEFVKYTIVMRPFFDLFGDRYSEREERRAKEDAAKRVMVSDEKKANGVNGVQSGTITNGVNIESI